MSSLVSGRPRCNSVTTATRLSCKQPPARPGRIACREALPPRQHVRPSGAACPPSLHVPASAPSSAPVTGTAQPGWASRSPHRAEVVRKRDPGPRASTHLGSGRPKRAELSVPPVLPAAPGDFRRQPSRPLCPSWHPTWFLEESVLTREQVGAAFKYFGAGELAPGANDYSPLGEDYAVTATATRPRGRRRSARHLGDHSRAGRGPAGGDRSRGRVDRGAVHRLIPGGANGLWRGQPGRLDSPFASPALVAQLDRASRYGREGRGFESLRAR